MKLLEILKRIRDTIRDVLHDCCGQIDNELLEIPRQVIESFARLLLPKIQQFFESEDGQREFARWKRIQAKHDTNEA